MSTTTLIIGPEHDGQRMSLADFENAEVREGYVYELGRGVVVVNKIPKKPHLQQLKTISRQVHRYDASNPGVIDTIAGGSDAKILLKGSNSERHPDLSIYKTEMPDVENVWSVWIPEIVVEVVSPSSRRRDYDEKPDEHLDFGIQEYWIVDAKQSVLTVLRRSDEKWEELTVNPPAQHTTHLLPGFELDVAAVFEAAKGT